MTIKLNNIRKTYSGPSGNVAAVDGISLNIPENKIFGIIGKSGAGKSSLVRLISLLEECDEGEIFYNDKKVNGLSKKELIMQRRKFGMIFQNFNLFSSRTAARNIAYPLEICGTQKKEIESRVKEMLELVGLEDRADAPVSTLSGGQKQRIAIARALATKPDILFCDEATSALDPQTTRAILNLIREIQKKMNLTVVMITHQMEVVRDACDEVAVVDQGKIVEQGTVEEIFNNPKSPVTQDFLSHLHTDTSIIKWGNEIPSYEILFHSDASGKPLLSTAAKKFDLDFNILAAGIQDIKGNKLGVMAANIFGSDDNINACIKWLEENNVEIKKL